MQSVRKSGSVQKSTGSRDDRKMTLRVSDESVDRDGDCVIATGIDTGSYMKNPIVLWSHSWTTPPVGKMLRMWLGADKRSLYGEMEWSVETELARDLQRLYKSEMLRACSVGFRTLRVGSPSHQILQGGAERCHRMIFAAELVEVSLCCVPSNANALRVAVEKGLVRSSQLKDLVMKSAGDKEHDKSDREAARQRVQSRLGWTVERVNSLAEDDVVRLDVMLAKDTDGSSCPNKPGTGGCPEEQKCATCKRKKSECRCGPSLDDLNKAFRLTRPIVEKVAEGVAAAIIDTMAANGQRRGSRR
jgi:HK97 family phage prohead protease